MDLRWWLIAVLAVLCLAAGAAAAWLLPVQRMQRQLRPLAHVHRLTRLPEFARVHRVYVVSMATTAGLLLICFLAAVTAAARPQHLAADHEDYDAVHPIDTMLCVGQPVTDPTTAALFSYYADQVKSFTNDQIGVTSNDLRVMPMTRDREFAEQRLRYFAGLPEIQQRLDTNQDVPDEHRLELAAGIEAFARDIKYVDYAQTVEDALALCIAGFPTFDKPSEHRRQLVYLGYSRLRASDDKRGSLYDGESVQAMAEQGGIQINAISRADVAEKSQEGNDTLRQLADASGGRLTLYNPAGTAGSDGGANKVLTDDLDDIKANPPPPSVSGTAADLHVEGPQIALSVAVISVVLLSLALLGLRR